jgi:hypothetical protein
MERRQSVRFRLRVPVVYQWHDQPGMKHERAGFSRDISKAGVFVICSVLPPIGITIALELQLPPLEGQREKGFRMEAKGTVTRLEQTGFAAASPFEKLTLNESIS